MTFLWRIRSWVLQNPLRRGVTIVTLMIVCSFFLSQWIAQTFFNKVPVVALNPPILSLIISLMCGLAFLWIIKDNARHLTQDEIEYIKSHLQLAFMCPSVSETEEVLSFFNTQHGVNCFFHIRVDDEMYLDKTMLLQIIPPLLQELWAHILVSRKESTNPYYMVVFEVPGGGDGFSRPIVRWLTQHLHAKLNLPTYCFIGHDGCSVGATHEGLLENVRLLQKDLNDPFAQLTVCWIDEEGFVDETVL